MVSPSGLHLFPPTCCEFLPTSPLPANVSPMKVSGWEEVRGEEDKYRVKKKTHSGFEFPCFSVHHSSTTHLPPQRETLSSFFSSHSPTNPLLLHCICFLIRSVWEANEPLPPPAHPPHHLLFSHWSQCCNLHPFDFLSAPFCLFFFPATVCMHLSHFFACHLWSRCFTPTDFLSLRLS